MHVVHPLRDIQFIDLNIDHEWVHLDFQAKEKLVGSGKC